VCFSKKYLVLKGGDLEKKEERRKKKEELVNSKERESSTKREGCLESYFNSYWTNNST